MLHTNNGVCTEVCGLSKRNVKFAEAVRIHRTLNKMTRTDLAGRAWIDASYLTLIENYGYVPKQDKVICLADAMCLNKMETDVLLLTAGYAPIHMDLKDVVSAVKRHHESSSPVPSSYPSEESQ